MVVYIVWRDEDMLTRNVYGVTSNMETATRMAREMGNNWWAYVRMSVFIPDGGEFTYGGDYKFKPDGEWHKDKWDSFLEDYRERC